MPGRKLLLSTAYFGPVHYYARYLKHGEILIEQFEHFNKQTYRNRCIILGANGPLSLVVPVVKGRDKKIIINELKISYDENWQYNHWRSIFSAYNSSPFFEYYKDELFYFFNKRWKFLLDLNLEIHESICKLLEIENKAILTKSFVNNHESTYILRDIISPKNKTVNDPAFHPAEYTQVFSEKFGFVPNLSILDLLFNEGPNSYTLLNSSLISDL